MSIRARVMAAVLASGIASWVSTASAASPFAKTPSIEELEASPAYRYANMSDEDALRELDRRGIAYERLAAVSGVRAPVRLSGTLHGVNIHSSLPAAERTDSPFEILDARLALALDDFTALLESHDVVELVHYTMYRPNVGKPTAETIESKGALATSHAVKGKDGDEKSSEKSDKPAHKKSKKKKSEAKDGKVASKKKGKHKKGSASTSESSTAVAKADHAAAKPDHAAAKPDHAAAKPSAEAVAAAPLKDSAPAAQKTAPVELALSKGAIALDGTPAEPITTPASTPSVEAKPADEKAAATTTEKPRHRHGKGDKAHRASKHGDKAEALSEKSEKAERHEKHDGDKADKHDGEKSDKHDGDKHGEHDKSHKGSKDKSKKHGKKHGDKHGDKHDDAKEQPHRGTEKPKAESSAGEEDARLETEAPIKQVAWAPPGTRHPAGLAIDVGAMKKSDGRWLMVADHFGGHIGSATCGNTAKPPTTAEGSELWSIVCESSQAGLFSYVLTPNYNAAHADHFHMEIKPGSRLVLFH